MADNTPITLDKRVTDMLNSLAQYLKKQPEPKRLKVLCDFVPKCFPTEREWDNYKITLEANQEGVTWEKDPDPFEPGELKALNKKNSVSVNPNKVTKNDFVKLSGKNFEVKNEKQRLIQSDGNEILACVNQVLVTSDKLLLFTLCIMALSKKDSVHRAIKEPFITTVVMNPKENITIITGSVKHLDRDFRVLGYKGRPVITTSDLASHKRGQAPKGIVGRIFGNMAQIAGKDNLVGAGFTLLSKLPI